MPCDPIDYLVSRKHLGLTGRDEVIRENRRNFERCFRRPFMDDEGSRPTAIEIAAEAAASAYRIELLAESPTMIGELYRSERAKQRDEEEAARWFNQPSAAADFDHYSKCAHWTLDEAVALSCGKEPRLVNWELVQPLVEVSAFARSYERRRDLTRRALIAGQLFEPVTPGIYISWAKKRNIPLPDGLVTRARNNGISLKDWQDLYEAQLKHSEAIAEQAKRHSDRVVAQNESNLHELSNKYRENATKMQEELDTAVAKIELLEQQLTTLTRAPRDSMKNVDLGTKERETLQLISLAGSLRGYKYDPDSKRTTTATKMSADLERLGLYISDDTIRKHLNKAAERLPGNWRERFFR